MSNITPTSVDLDQLLASTKNQNQATVVKIGDAEIKVLKYLGTQEKIDIANAIISRCLNINTIDPIILYVELALCTILRGTNIIIPDEQKQDRLGLFDTLNNHGIVKAVMDNVEPSEIADIIASVNEATRASSERYCSMSGAIATILDLMEDRAENMSEMLNSFDKDKYAEMIDFVKSANNGQLPE